jgi:hypothetical protein
MSGGNDNHGYRQGLSYDLRYREPKTGRYLFVTLKFSDRPEADEQINQYRTLLTEGLLRSKDSITEEEYHDRAAWLENLASAEIETGVDYVLVDHHGALVPCKPPTYGERLLYFLLSKEERKNLIGDLAEEYIELQAKHGLKFARAWYWKQVCGSFFSLAIRAVRWVLYAGVVEWFRRHI